MKTHYLKAWFNENGYALSPLDPKVVNNQACKKKQIYVLHTKYFYTREIRRSAIDDKFDTRLYCAPLAKSLNTNQRDLSYYTGTSVPPTTNETVTNCNADVLVPVPPTPTGSINNDILGKRNTLPEVKVPVPVCSLTDLPRSNSPMASPPLSSTISNQACTMKLKSDVNFNAMELVKVKKQYE